MAIERDMKLLTASDVAELCEVDLKTIHNWVERGCIPHFRTPGRHLRFQAVDVAKFLREWGYAIPRRFYAEIAQSVVVLGGKDAVGFVQKSVGANIAVHGVDDLYACLLHIGAEPTSAVVIETPMADNVADSLAGAVGALQRAFTSMTIVLLGDDSAHLADSLGVPVVPSGESKALRTALAGDHGQALEAPAAAAALQPAPIAPPIPRVKRKVRKPV